MKNQNTQIQKGHQGDVQFMEVNKLPDDLQKIEKQPVAYGEASGHIHVITGDYVMYKTNYGFYVKTGTDGAMLQHVRQEAFRDRYDTDIKIEQADHGTVKMKPNTVFKIAIQKQYNPYKKIFEWVID